MNWIGIIFYAQGVKTNVLFFTRGKTDEDAITQLEMAIDLIKDVVKELKKNGRKYRL